MNVMVDIETLGQAPHGAIVDIGWAFFDEEGLQHGAAAKVDVEDSLRHGIVDGSTLCWWFRQSAEAIAEVFGSEGRVPLHEALNKLNAAIEKENPELVWFNPPTFDASILRFACSRLGLVPCWDFRQERCLRTLVGVAKGLDPTFECYESELAHSALSDARAQARTAARAMRLLKSIPSDVPRGQI